MQLTIIGGDIRQLRVIKRMLKNFHDLKICCVDKEYLTEDVFVADICDVLRSEYIILPLPYTTDGENINAPLWKDKISIDEVMKICDNKTVVFAGKCDKKIKDLALERGFRLIDYFECEELTTANAVPTAEGAIQIAMEETLHTLSGSECLVTGGGRISRVLSKMLQGIGADVTIAARKQYDLSMAEALGFKSCNINMLNEKIQDYDIIFNTVPAMIIDSDILSCVKKDSLIIDLASKPGGVDFEFASKAGIKTIHALSLPGKVAPHTAGDIISETILNIFREMEVI